MQNSSFRYDINGLRAIAVIAVVLFHFNASWMPGGFAGVDVFFVISGFLMTGIIFRGIEQENFSLIKFYISRANRIIPPLLILCLTLLILGWFFLAPWEYKTLGRDVATSLLFISNFMFSMKMGYFDDINHIFLLHTWSLSTEWQFYIIYPIVLLIFKRFLSIDNLKKLVLAFFIISFIISIYATQIWPNQSYFLLPTRAWEMLLGGIAFLYPLKSNTGKILKNRKFLEIIGIFLIIISYIFISENNPWPGYLAFIPTIGTWLIIQAQRQDSLITNNFLFQKIGLWSYSIYLWHWPIANSFRYFEIEEKYKICGIFLSIILGYLSFKLIEKRNFKSVSIIKPIFIYLTITLIPVSIGAYIFKTQGMVQRKNLNDSLIHGGTGNNYIINEGVNLLNTEKDYDYLLLGDSHSSHYTRGINRYHTKVKNSWYSTCMSFPDSINVRPGNHGDWKESCQNNYKLGLRENKKIIIAQSWDRPENGSLQCINDNCSLTGKYHKDLQVQLDKLLSLYGENKEIYVIGEVPKPKDHKIPICLRSELLSGINRNCITSSQPSDESNLINKILSETVSKHKNVRFIDVRNAICKDNICHYSIGGKSIFMSDASHLSGYGSEVLWKFVIDTIEKKNTSIN